MGKKTKTIGELVKTARVSAGLTQVELAAAAKISQPYVTLIEKGEKQPTIATLKQIAAACGVPFASLAGD